MSEHLCCDRAVESVNVARFGLRSAGWIVPSAILAVMPKCPVCFAAYVALLTGVGLSLNAAAYLRVFLMMFCAGLLVYIAARSIHRVASQSRNEHGPQSK
jgi:membrane protein implicated in regulation of membrane protease activity